MKEVAIYLSLIVCIIGGLVYLFIEPTPTSPRTTKLAELGRLAFWVGLLTFLFGK